jgi:hypothetical protein
MFLIEENIGETIFFSISYKMAFSFPEHTLQSSLMLKAAFILFKQALQTWAFKGT